MSNSSSSSFVVGFAKVPESVEEMQAMLFPDGRDKVVDPYDYAPRDMSTRLVAEVVFADLVVGEPLGSFEEFLEIVQEGYCDDGSVEDPDDLAPLAEIDDRYRQKYGPTASFSEHSDWRAERMAAHRDRWERGLQREEENTRRWAEAQWPKFAGLTVYVFEYDDGGVYPLLEYGDIFGELPHVRISGH